MHGQDVVKGKIITIASGHDKDEDAVTRDTPLCMRRSVPMNVVSCSLDCIQHVSDRTKVLTYLERELAGVRHTQDSVHWKLSENLLEWLIDGLRSNDTHSFTLKSLPTKPHGDTV